MGTYLTAAGFKRPSFTELLVQTQNNFKTAFGADFDLTPDSPNGHLVNSFALQLDSAWGAVQEVYDSLNPNSADGVGLDNAMAFSGLSRHPATRLRGNVVLFTDGGPVDVPAGTVAIRERGSLRLLCTDSVVVSASAANVARFRVGDDTDVSGAFEFGFGTYNVSGRTAKAALSALVNATSLYLNASVSEDGLMTTFTPKTGDTMSVIACPDWASCEVGVNANFTAEGTGEETAERGEVNALENPIEGITSVENVEPMVSGSDVEGDTDARRRVIAYNRHGKDTSTEHAIESHLLNFVEGVTYAKVTSNRGMDTSPTGQPGKSFEAVVVGGTDAAVANGIMESMSAGVEPYGEVEVAVTDEQGDEQVIRFSRPRTRYLWVDVVYTRYMEQVLPDGIEGDIAAAVTELSRIELTIGADVLPDRFKQAVYGASTAISRAIIRCALSDDPDSRPSSSAFTESDIAVAGNAIAVLAPARVSMRRA